MDPLNNPFVPGAGTPPPELVGREGLLDQVRIALARTHKGVPAKSLIAVGLRGVGKTVLLNRCEAMTVELGYLPIQIEAQERLGIARSLAPQIRKAVLQLDRIGAVNDTVKRSLRAFRGWLGTLKLAYGDLELRLDVEPEIGLADSGALEADLPDLFAALGDAAAARQRPIALIVDELQYLDELNLGALIMALHRTAQRQLPVMMVAAGLPSIVALSGQARSYAERLFDFPNVGQLSDEDAHRAILLPIERQGATITADALDAIVAATAGYPYFLQEWGYHSWNAAAGTRITAEDVRAAERAALRNLDEGFFRVRYDNLTPFEKDYLRAMAALGPGPHRSGDIARELGRSTTDMGPRRDTLIRKGMIWSPAHGDTAFTVPLFDRFLRRVMPDWSPPERRPRSRQHPRGE